MKILGVVEARHWQHTSGRTASLYGAAPWTGAPGDMKPSRGRFPIQRRLLGGRQVKAPRLRVGVAPTYLQESTAETSTLRRGWAIFSLSGARSSGREGRKTSSHGGTVTVCFHIHGEKAHVVTVGSWRGAGHTSFTVTTEEARADWKRLAGEGFKRVHRTETGSVAA